MSVRSLSSRPARLTTRLGDIRAEGPKLDLDGFFVFIPLSMALFLYFGLEQFMPLAWRGMTTNLVTVGVLAAACWALQKEYRPAIAQFGMHRAALRSSKVLSWTLIGVCLSVLRHSITVFASELTPTGLSAGCLANVHATSALGLNPVLFLGVLGPVGEEFLFRGYICLIAQQNWGFLWACILSSGLFSLVHLNADPLFFLTSLVYVYLNNEAKSLMPSIAAHVTWNVGVLLFPP
jgi:membrane protease YdiL (CAAX protease family)